MKSIKKWVLRQIMVFAFMLTPMILTGMNAEVAIAATTVKLNSSKVSLYVGESYTLKLSGVKSKITWTSNNKAVATVSSTGVVKGVKKGTAKVTATVGNKKYTCTVTVKDPKLNQTKAELKIGESQILKIIGNSKKVTWKSSKNTVVSVNKDGLVEAKGLGSATITGTVDGKKYSCKVTVGGSRFYTSMNKITCYDEIITAVLLENWGDDELINYTTNNDNIEVYDTETGSGDYFFLRIVPKKVGTSVITFTTSTDNSKLEITVTVVDAKKKAKVLTAKEVYKSCSKATVQIVTDVGVGTGFFYDTGKVVTNYHVIKGAKKITVNFTDGTSFEVKNILSLNEYVDLAVLSVPVSVTPLKLNQKEVSSGDTVYAIGSSLGVLTDTFTNGIVTNANRYVDDIHYIQTNAAITNGNSGGPLLNEYGEVIGINTWQYVNGQNINFAISIEELYYMTIFHGFSIDDMNGNTVEEDVSEEGNVEKNPAENTEPTIVYEDTLLSKSKEGCQDIENNILMYGHIEPDAVDYYQFTVTKKGTVGVICLIDKSQITDFMKFSFGVYNKTDDKLICVNDYGQMGDYYWYYTEKEFEAGTYYVTPYYSATGALRSVPYYLQVVQE